MKQRVRIFDTTLRDGEQTPGVHLSADQKCEIAKALEAFGVATIEAGFPASSPGDAEAVARVARTVQDCEVAGLARCCDADIDAVRHALADAAAPVVHIVLGVSDIHLEAKLNISRADALRRIERSVVRAAQDGAVVQFSAEDSTRADRVFLRQCVETAVCAGAMRVNVPDTVGFAVPEEYGAMVREVVRFVGEEVVVSAHCHDDLGMATANTVAAVRNGARQVEVAVNGIGERAGNAATEEVAAVLHVKAIAETGVQLQSVQALSRCVAEETGVPVSPNHPVVGSHAFAHSSGIHQDGILKNRATYEFLSPEVVGVGDHRFVFTARSGRSAVAHCVRGLGFEPNREEMDNVYRRFLSAADVQMGAVPQSAIAVIASEVCGPASS